MVIGRWGRLARAGLLLVLLAQHGPAQAVGDAPSVRGVLAFDGDATVGAFTGTTSSLTGALIGASRLAGVRGWIAAKTGTLVTGNGHRDRDMYKSLEVEKYPTMRFDLDSIGETGSAGDSVAVILHGHLTVHGQTRMVTVPGFIWLGPAADRFRGRFPMNLKEYKIGGLSKMLGILKMHENIVVRVDVTFERR